MVRVRRSRPDDICSLEIPAVRPAAVNSWNCSTVTPAASAECCRFATISVVLVMNSAMAPAPSAPARPAKPPCSNSAAEFRPSNCFWIWPKAESTSLPSLVRPALMPANCPVKLMMTSPSLAAIRLRPRLAAEETLHSPLELFLLLFVELLDRRSAHIRNQILDLNLRIARHLLPDLHGAERDEPGIAEGFELVVGHPFDQLEDRHAPFELGDGAAEKRREAEAESPHRAPDQFFRASSTASASVCFTRFRSCARLKRWLSACALLAPSASISSSVKSRFPSASQMVNTSRRERKSGSTVPFIAPRIEMM